MTTLKIGNKVSNFTANATGETRFNLSSYANEHNLVLYFYPKDSTPGCTTEGQDFRDLQSEFSNADTLIFGISRDSLTSHEKFKDKQSFNFELISDEDESVCQLFDVIKEKNMYGRKYMGIERSTFLLDKQGTLVKEWRKVRVKNHVKDVLTAAQALK